MRSLIVFLHLVALTHISDGAPVSQARPNGVTQAVNSVTCEIAGVAIVDPATALDELNGGTTPPGVQGLSTQELENILRSCLASNARINTAANGGAGATGGGRGRGGFGGSRSDSDVFDDGADGNGNLAAYSGTTYTSNDLSASGNSPAIGLNAPNAKYAGYPSHVYSDSPPSGLTSDSGTTSDSGSSTQGVDNGSDDTAVYAPTNSRYSAINFPADDGFVPYGSDEGPDADRGRFEFGGRGGGRGTGGTGNSAFGLGGTTQRTVTARPGQTCEGNVCTNIDAQEPAVGRFEAAPVLGSTPSGLVPGAKVPVVREGDRGCSNANVHACLDSGTTS